MATTKQLLNGTWFLNWFTSASSSVQNVQCDQTSLQLSSNMINNQVTLSLKVNPGKNVVMIWRTFTYKIHQVVYLFFKCTATSQCGTTTEPSRTGQAPLQVHAAYNGELRKMIASGCGTWASVSWPYESTNYNPNGYYSGFGTPPKIYAAYQLILEFKDTSFAEGERQVLTHLSKLLDTQTMSDVTFGVKNEKIGAHSAIVVSASPVICAMLEKDNFKEGRTKTVKIDDIDPSVFKEVLRYLYTGKAPKLNEDAMTEPLFLAADKYQIEALKDLCEQSLITKLNVQTVVHYLVVAHLYTAPQLLEASLKFLVSYKTVVWTRPEWKELMKTYPDLFFLASHRMVA
jgi:speckle-type POZ protein